MKRINALTIAGTDPSGGAGIQADLKAFSALGAYGASVITALVAQNTRGVQSVYHIEPAFVAAQLDSVLSDVRIDSVKIGMLANADIVQAVAERLRHYQPPFVVLDTVMLAKSGDPLLAPEAVASIRRELLPQVSLITPNLPEAAALLACPPADNEQQMREQGRALLAMGCQAVLMKGAISVKKKARTGCSAAVRSSASARRASPRAIRTAPAAPCLRHWPPCVRVMTTGRRRWRRRRITCSVRCSRRIAWKSVRHRPGAPFPCLVVSQLFARRWSE